MFLRTLSTFVAVCSTAYLVAFAAPPTNPSNEDPACSSGTHPGFEFNTFQYIVPYDAVYGKIGSFFQSEWYTGPVNSTQGTDNAVGAKRTATITRVTFTEELIGYTQSPGRFSMRFVISDPPHTFGGVSFSSYTVEIGAASICGGKATYIEILAAYCADNPVLGYDVFDTANKITVSAVARELGAVIFAGACPNQ